MSDTAPLTIRLNANDNVVVARTEILPNTQVPGEGVSTRAPVPRGHKIATAAIAKGEVVTPDSLPADSRDEFIPGRWPGHEAGLSAREAEILALLCQGLSNDDIAERAYLSTSTVRTYLRTLFSKLDVQSRTQAVLWGVEHGFRPDERRKT